VLVLACGHAEETRRTTSDVIKTGRFMDHLID